MLPAAQQLPKLSSPPYTPLHGDPGMVQIAALLPQECGLEVVSRQPSLVATSKHSRFSPATCASLRTARWLGSVPRVSTNVQPQGSGSWTGRVPRLHHRPDAAAVAAANALGVAGAGSPPANAARQELPPPARPARHVRPHQARCPGSQLARVPPHTASAASRCGGAASAASALLPLLLGCPPGDGGSLPPASSAAPHMRPQPRVAATPTARCSTRTPASTARCCRR